MKRGEREKYSAHPYLRNTMYIERLIHFSGISRQSMALDLCCGAGYSSIVFAQYVKSVVGIDNDKNMLEKAQENAETSKVENVHIKYGNAEALDFDDKTFDIVIARGSFRHLANFQKAIHECYRVLKPTGKLFVAEMVVPKEIIELWTEISITRTGAKKHYWTYNFLLRQFREHGFDPIIIIPTRHKQDLSKWLNEIDMENQRTTAKQNILSLSEQARKDIYLSESEPYYFIYDAVEILFEKCCVGQD